MKAFVQILLLLLTTAVAKSQALTIGSNSRLIMRGNVSLVVRNAALINNGQVVESNSTLHFTGHKDTTHSYLGGSSNTTLYNLTINKSAAGTALKSTATVRNVLGVYGGVLHADSNLVLKSDAALTARVDAVPAGANIYGKAIVERYFPNRRAWRLVTAPLTATTSIFDTWQNKGVYQAGINTSVTGPNPTGAGGNGLDASPMNNASMKTWNTNTQALEPVLNTKVSLSAGNSGNADNTGYFLFVRGDRDYNNFYLPNSNNTTLRSNGKLQVGTQAFTAATTAGGYTLIGNPFASPVDFNKLNRSNLVKRFYVWDPLLNELGAYVMLDDLDNDGIYTKSIMASGQTKHIQSGQAFFVETQAAGSAGISFTESSKSDGNNNAVFRPGHSNGNNEIAQSLRIVLHLKENDGSLITADGVLLEAAGNYNTAIDRDDALKFSNINETLAILRNGYPLAAERRPQLTENDTIFLRLQRSSKRNYSFEIAPAAINNPTLTAWLEDSYLNRSTAVSLTETTVHDFTIDDNSASAATNRFKIVFKNLSVLPDFAIELSATMENNNAIINWRVKEEANITSYTVEKSTDGISFSTLTSQQATGSASYSSTDKNINATIQYYRIKYTDITGAVKYSNVVKVKTGNLHNNISIYPNPVQNNIINIQFTNQPQGRYQLRLLGNDGRLLYETITHCNSNSHKVQLVPTVKLAAGEYLLEIKNNNGSSILRSILVQ